MTVASECILTSEVGLPYAAVCVVDNLANGLGDTPLTLDEFQAGRRREPGPVARGSRRAPPPAGAGVSGLCVTDVVHDGERAARCARSTA